MIALAILRRLLVALVTLAGVAIVVFVLLRVVPGDPIAMMISPGASQADIAALRAHYGLDGGLLSQFAVWVRYALRGDFGTSISLHRDVLALLGERLPATLELATAALEFALIVGGAVAILGAMARRTWAEPVIDAVNGLFLAIPDFVGLSPTSAGLYQVNVVIPQGVPKGNLYLTVDFGDSTSNPVQIAIQ